jgi:hypothetical protein
MLPGCGCVAAAPRALRKGFGGLGFYSGAHRRAALLPQSRRILVVAPCLHAAMCPRPAPRPVASRVRASALLQKPLPHTPRPWRLAQPSTTEQPGRPRGTMWRRRLRFTREKRLSNPCGCLTVECVLYVPAQFLAWPVHLWMPSQVFRDLRNRIHSHVIPGTDTSCSSLSRVRCAPRPSPPPTHPTTSHSTQSHPCVAWPVARNG